MSRNSSPKKNSITSSDEYEKTYQGYKLYVALSVAKGLRRFAAGFFTPFGRSE